MNADYGSTCVRCDGWPNKVDGNFFEEHGLAIVRKINAIVADLHCYRAAHTSWAAALNDGARNESKR
jgi:hypothetical protein